MMSREIKFRGRDKETGELVCGDLDTTPTIWAIFSADGMNVWRIRPESVRQLVGRTKAGKEIYEGDRVRLKTGETVIATLKSNLEGLL